MRLGIVLVHQLLYTRIPDFLVFGYIMTQSCNYIVHETFSLPTYLRVIGCCGELLYLEKMAKCSKESGNNLGSIVGHYVQMYPIWHDAFVQEYCPYLCLIVSD